MYRNIIWDVDGTLFDTYPAIAEAFGRVLSEYGIDSDRGWLMSLARQSVGHCVTTLAGVYNVAETAIEARFESHYGQMDYSAQPPFPRVREICSSMRRAGGSNVIVTHRDRGSTLGLLQAHQLAELFTGWVTRDDGYPRKPDPAAFTAALDRYDLDPRVTMAVGDRDIDTVAAHGAGLFTCQFAPERGAAGPDLHVIDFAELADFLERLSVRQGTCRPATSRPATSRPAAARDPGIKELRSEEEVRACVHLLRTAFGTVAAEFGLTAESAPTNAAFTTLENLNHHRDRGMVLYGMFSDARLVGCVAIKRSKQDETVFFIERLAVLPELRRHGRGGRLVQFALQTIRELGGRVASIGVMDSNARLKAWYSAQGFVRRDCRRIEHLPFKVCFMSMDLGRELSPAR